MAKSTKVVYVVVVTLTFIMAIYNIYTLLFTTYDIFAHMSMNLIFALPLAFILYSGRKGAERISWYNIMLAIISIIPPLMLYLNYGEWVYGRFWFAASVQPIQIILGTIFLITIIELVRRYGGTILAILIIFFLIFLYIGPYIPYPFTHKGMSYERIIELNYITTYGTFITPLQVLSTYVIAFTILGAIFSYTGIGQYFIDLSKFLVGRMVGGPAKIATVASSLFGTISGSAVANVYGTGVITIPTMKGLGYPAAFAGATEAVASTGGQIMPPIMGAAAFVMAELLDIPYSKIMIAAIIPALLYYLGVYVQVHYFSIKNRLTGLPKEEIPHLKHILINSYMLIPMVVLVYIVAVLMWSPVTAAFISGFIAIVLSYLRRDTMITPKKLILALSKGAEDAIPMLIVGAGAGIIIGSISFSGVALRLSSIVQSASLGFMQLALFYVAVITLIMGMGVPTTAAYIMTAALSVPALSTLGIETLPAHFFIFYYATISAITPPVALAAYAASTLAKEDPMKIGFQAVKLGFAALLVPFVFVFKPSLLIITGRPFTEIIYDAFIAFIAIFSIAVALEGYIKHKMNLIERSILMISGVLLLMPTQFFIDFIFISIILIVIIIHRKRK